MSPEKLAAEYSTSVAKKALDQSKVQGEAAVKMIEQSVAPAVGLQGQGTHVNTFG